jgi:exopolyphosphatase / guanosine-5'-triphosphate,3'-diphosphate pyrophosphatase
MEHMAVIDLGSNSFRLVAYGYEPGHHWMREDEIREAVRVGAGMGDDSVLRPKPLERALNTAAVFAAFCRASGIDDVEAVATSAIRDAANQAELLDAIRERSGLDVRVLDEGEEARYGYLAVANSTTVVDGFGIDIGGGSVQLVQIEDRRLVKSASWRLGAVRISERFLPGEEAKPKAIKALRKHVRRELESAGWAAAEPGQRLAGIGGTIRNLAAAAQKQAGHPSTGVQGFELTRDALDELIAELASKPASKRSRVPGIKPDRGDVILAGALVLATTMEHAGFASVEVTEAGLREGVLFERYLEAVDPPLFEDVRRASVMNLANRYYESLVHARHVAELSLETYDGLVSALGEGASALQGDPDGATLRGDRELLWAAGILHDIGMAVDYDDHHKHSQYLIQNASLPGFSPRELLLIALIARYHRKGDPDTGELGPLAKKGDARRLGLLAGIIRLAEQLERSRNQSVRAVHVHSEDGRVLVEADAERGPDAGVAIWAAQRNAGLLARTIGRELQISSA